MNRLTPSTAVRAYCTHCLGLPRYNAEEIRTCQGDKAPCGPCPLFPYRMGRRVSVKVLRRFCLQCQGGDREGVADCSTASCPVFPYRHGTNPARRGTGASREAMQNVREAGKIARESIFSGSEGKPTR
jgi:hypothetical protein